MSNLYEVLIAVGLALFAAAGLVTHETGRIVVVVLSVVAFAVAALSAAGVL